LINKLEPNEKNYVFALNYDGIYKLLKSSQEDDSKIQVSKEELLYDTYMSIKDIISISSDKKSGIITLKAESNDRFLAKELVDIYLKELTTYLRQIEMQDVQKQIDYYTKEMERIDEIGMKEQLSQLASGLVQKKVLSMANEFYNVKQLTKSQVSHIKEKSKPKRALVVIVGFITSLILGIFLIFLLEFIRNDNK
jgi:uncharacterized protein involved in exopolysaccharide biosynthesis